MFRYLLALLLISTDSRSLGVPLKETAANSPLANMLATLASRCGNVFISNQIKAKLNECNVIVPPYDGKQFECMLFYDINKQLCDAMAQRKKLSEDFTMKINEFLDVEKTCANARNWTVTDISEYPKYKDIVSKVLQARLGCIKVCGVDDLTSQDTNFFCKYYKRGSDMLIGLTSTANTVQLTGSSNITSIEEVKIPASAGSATNSSNKVSTVVANLASTTTNISKLTEEKGTSKVLVKEESHAKVDSVQPQDKLSSFNDVVLDDSKVDIEVRVNKTTKPEVPTSVSATSETMDKPTAAEIETPKKEEVQNGIEDNDQPEEQKESAKKFKITYQADPEYPDSEEGKEGLVDGEDNGDDPMLGAELEQKPEIQSQTSKSTKKIETSMTFVGEREFYPNSIQDQFVEDDDHFFPFFLTAVILVIILYVLYHNKSKVSKLVLGLLVEGRQSGRRRNSRGHAYKRLDTLEQAMSTNSAAPPSKIIY